MADSNIRVPADSSGKKVDCSSLDVGVDTVYRQRIVIADNSATAQYATVTGGALTITGNVNLSATATVTGNVNISATATVTGNVNISATANVVLGAGVANIGLLNSISRTVQVAIGTPFTLNDISATVTVAGSVTVSGNINVSATASMIIAGAADVTDGTLVRFGDSANTAIRVNMVAGTITGGGVSHTDGTPFTAQASALTPIGGVFDDTSPDTLSEGDAGIVRMTSSRAIHANIRHSNGNEVSTASALPVHVVNGTTTSTVVIGLSPLTGLSSASHGPKMVTVSTSANATLIASPGAGNYIYVTQIMAGNYSSTLTRLRIGTSASTGALTQPLAASGGGFVYNFDPPWKMSASEAALCSVKPNVSEVNITINFYVKAE